MNVFVLCTGRCGSVTFEKACRYMSNYSSSHEAETGLHVTHRLNFNDNHIEVDNRLAWMLGALDHKYGDDAYYVHLIRDRISTAKSYNARWEKDLSIMPAYTQGILMRDSQGLDDCIDFYDTVNTNITHFLKDKTRKIIINLDNIEEDYVRFWDAIGAEGDIDSAINELKQKHNPTIIAKTPASIGGNHSVRSLKQLHILNKLSKDILDLKTAFNEDKNTLYKSIDSSLENTSEKLGLILEGIDEKGKLERKTFNNKIKSLNASLEKEKSLSKQVKLKLSHQENSLAMFLGTALIQSTRSPINLLKSPHTLYKAVKKYKSRSKLIQSNMKELAALETKHQWPKPNRYSIIYQAFHIAQDNGYESAIKFVNTYGSEQDKIAASVFCANKNHNNDDLWLDNLNQYITSFGVSPIKLKESSEERFFRICNSEKLEKVDGCKVSIIMPAYNAEKTISFALQSILNQTWSNIEVIVVDDASSDNTFQIISEFAKIDDRVKVFKNKVNVGPYVSKNFGLKHVTGEFITGHDSDDWAHPQRIAQQVEIMIEKPALKATITKMLRVDENGLGTSFSKIGKTSTDGVIRIASISCMFDTSFFKNNFGSWDCVRFGADSELISRAQKILGDNFEELNLFGMICLDREGSLTNDPTHGVSKTTGISPTRKYYRDQWTNWHQDLDIDNAYLSFPQENRKFDAPEAALVNNSDINKLLS